MSKEEEKSKDETVQVCKEILASIGMGRKWSENQSYSDVFESLEAVMSNLAFLVGPLTDAEVEFNKLVIFYHEEKDMSVAGATAKAKTEPQYVWYKKLKHTYELGHEHVMAIKKFSDKLQDEWQRTQ